MTCCLWVLALLNEGPLPNPLEAYPGSSLHSMHCHCSVIFKDWLEQVKQQLHRVLQQWSISIHSQALNLLAQAAFWGNAD